MDNARGKLRPEMYGTIRHTDSMKTVPVVPVGAVLQGDGRPGGDRQRSRPQAPARAGRPDLGLAPDTGRGGRSGCATAPAPLPAPGRYPPRPVSGARRPR